MFYHQSFQQAKGEEAKEAKEAKDGAAKTGEGHGEVLNSACMFHSFFIDVCDVRWIFIGASKKIKKLDISELSELKSQTGR